MRKLIVMVDGLIGRIKYRLKMCQYPGCYSRHVTECWIPDDEPDEHRDLAFPDAYYCFEHAHYVGFCWMCGGFNGGIESFDFNRFGLCESCEMEADRDERKWDGDEEWDDDDPYDTSDTWYLNTVEEL